MKNYIQQLVELFGHNSYSAGTQKKVQQWLADEEHVEQVNKKLCENSECRYGNMQQLQ